MVKFPCILPRVMVSFVTVVGLLNLFKFIENRLCKGVDGKDVCCFGFSWNEKTGQCEKCPIGYFGQKCTRRCNYPFYGEDCQSICDCSKDGCHYSRGCVPIVETLSYQHFSFTKTYSTQTTTFSTVSSFNSTGYFSSVFTDFITEPSTKISDTTMKNLLQNKDLLKNSVVITLFGIFVLICSIFVIAYIYFKCHKKNQNTSGINQNDGHNQYKSLNFAAPETQSSAYLEQQVPLDADLTYLSPVFSQTESSQIPGFQENESRLDNNEVLEEPIMISNQGFSHNDTYTEIEPTVSLDVHVQTQHFYRELYQDV